MCCRVVDNSTARAQPTDARLVRVHDGSEVGSGSGSNLIDSDSGFQIRLVGREARPRRKLGGAMADSGRRKRRAHGGDWASLPLDITIVIAERLLAEDVVDYMSATEPPN